MVGGEEPVTLEEITNAISKSIRDSVGDDEDAYDTTLDAVQGLSSLLSGVYMTLVGIMEIDRDEIYQSFRKALARGSVEPSPDDDEDMGTTKFVLEMGLCILQRLDCMGVDPNLCLNLTHQFAVLGQASMEVHGDMLKNEIMNADREIS